MPDRSALLPSFLGILIGSMRSAVALIAVTTFFIVGSAQRAIAGTVEFPQQRALQLPSTFPATMQDTDSTPAPAPVTAQAPAAPQQAPNESQAPVDPPAAPANNESSPNPTVDWANYRLRIVASNSSLAEILFQVSSKTGAKLRGLEEDKRIYGTYGPGNARDVLTHLLEGLGYNVMIIGDQGHGAPRQIVLSQRPAPSTQRQSYVASDESDADVEPPAPEPQPAMAVPPQPQNTVPPGAAPRSPQEIMQEVQQRLQQLQQTQPTQPQQPAPPQ